MTLIYYFAAWTECGCLVSCWHEHKTVMEAASCIPCAGGYVVGVENGAIRSLKTEEEAEFQAVRGRPTEKLPTPASAEPGSRDSGYAVMTKIRVVDHCTWATWMCFDTYAEAVAHARVGDKVVRFSSEEWAALRQQKWVEQTQQADTAPPRDMNSARETLPSRLDGESLVEFVLRLLCALGLDRHAEPISDAKNGLINIDMIDLVLSRLDESETKKFERLYAENKHALMEALGNRFCTVLKPKTERT